MTVPTAELATIATSSKRTTPPPHYPRSNDLESPQDHFHKGKQEKSAPQA
jgi:hypothetical protein